MCQHVKVTLVRNRRAFKQYLIVFHHANHGIIVSARINQIGGSHGQRSEYVGTHRHCDVIRGHAVVRLLFDDLTHEVDDELERVAVELRQVGQQLLKFNDTTLRHDLGKLHEVVILAEGADRVLHLAHHLLPIVGYDVRLRDLGQVVEVVLAHMDLKLSHIGR